jgi:putative transposase
VQYFNRRYARRGTLWEGRFRSCLVDSAHYVLACYRYIERNPVRAGMAEAALAYRWSSHHGNVGAIDNKLLTPHPEFAALSQAPAVRYEQYRKLVADGDRPEFLVAVRDRSTP